MKIVRIWLGFILSVFACAANGTTLPRVTLSELFSNSDKVVFVEIAAGEVLSTEGGLCGAKYKGRVIENLKGSGVSDTIEFGYYIGYEVGSRYILFLSKRSKPFEPKRSTNAGIESAAREAMARCAKYQPPLMISHSGYGAMKVTWSSQFKYNDSVRIAERYVGLPDSMLKKPAKPSHNEEYSDVMWVSLIDFLAELRKMAK
jgi:hypothetical protein